MVYAAHDGVPDSVAQMTGWGFNPSDEGEFGRVVPMDDFEVLLSEFAEMQRLMGGHAFSNFVII
jgi:hypothetical protein